MDQARLEALARLRQRLADGSLPCEDVDCPLCGPAPFDVVSEREAYGLPCRVVICRKCGLLRTTPRMTRAAVETFYADDFRLVHGGHSEVAMAWTFAKVEARSSRIHAMAAAHLPSQGLVLEVGCGTGANLKVFQDRGFRVGGCDYGEAYLTYGRARGVGGLELGGVDQLLARYGPDADLVILSHVLEHFTDIPGELRKVARLMKPGGKLFVAVPGIHDIRRSTCLGNIVQYFIISHTYHFSQTTLTNVLARCGFERLSGDESIDAMFGRATWDTPPPIVSTYPADLRALRRLEWRWLTWTLPERFVWERRHLGMRRRASQARISLRRLITGRSRP